MATVLTEAAALPKRLATLLAKTHRSPFRERTDIDWSTLVIASDNATETLRDGVRGTDTGVPLSPAATSCRCSHVGQPVTSSVPKLASQYGQDTVNLLFGVRDWLAANASSRATDTLGSPWACRASFSGGNCAQCTDLTLGRLTCRC